MLLGDSPSGCSAVADRTLLVGYDKTRLFVNMKKAVRRRMAAAAGSASPSPSPGYGGRGTGLRALRLSSRTLYTKDYICM
ncbi:hypothetical protein E2C01_010812 [Portunus trituberculatus]|uniref:Uncharacterized protein n=1 Tax=Portunus trituberculatus TaxID=210409 RepID=A0A5B7D9L7_PORTR|nr:hypothetical protein [Portunus trituberculatus]